MRTLRAGETITSLAEVLATAEVAESPCGVAEHALLVVFAEKSDQGAHGTGLEDVVAALGAVTGNVTESPNSLLTDVEDGRRKELDEDGNSTSLITT